MLDVEDILVSGVTDFFHTQFVHSDTLRISSYVFNRPYSGHFENKLLRLQSSILEVHNLNPAFTVVVTWQTMAGRRQNTS